MPHCQNGCPNWDRLEQILKRPHKLKTIQANIGNDVCNMNINIIYVFEPMSQCFITEGNQNSASYDLALRHYYCILGIKNIAPLIKMYLGVIEQLQSKMV